MVHRLPLGATPGRGLRRRANTPAKSILMFQILNVIQNFQSCSRRCIGSFSPSPGTPGVGWGEGPSSTRREKAFTLSLSRSTGRGKPGTHRPSQFSSGVRAQLRGYKSARAADVTFSMSQTSFVVGLPLQLAKLPLDGTTNTGTILVIRDSFHGCVLRQTHLVKGVVAFQ